MRLLYVSRSSGGHDLRFKQAWESAGLEVCELSIGLDDADAESAMRHALDDCQPDIVQVGPLTTPGELVARLWDGPLIAASWGFDLLLDSKRSLKERRRAAFTVERADVVFVDNDATAAAAVDLGAAPAAIVQFPWGLESDWFAPAQVGARPSRSEHPLIVSVRNHEPLYRVADVIHAFAEAAARYPDAELIVTGVGSLTGELGALAEGLGVGERVRFVGAQTRAELRELYERGTVYVSASETDGSSISLLEAMSASIPCLVSDIPGNRQWADADTAWTYELGDVDSLAMRLIELIAMSDEDQAALTRKTEAARKRIVSNANWSLNVERFPDFASQAIRRATERKNRHDDDCHHSGAIRK